MQLAITQNPHVKEPQKLWEEFDHMDKPAEKIEEFDRAVMEALKNKIRGSTRIKVN
jgi:hypothetical protein